MDEVNTFLIGLGGGILGGILLCVNYYMLIISKSRQYISAKRVMKDRLLIAGLEQEIHDIKQYLNAIKKEYYANGKKL